jgi:hypothetical protein
MLSFSKKFPDFLRSRASAMHAKAVASSFTAKASLIERLASDPRMDTVLAELTKRVRSSYQPAPEYFHSARPPEYAAASLAMDPQHIAIEELFCWIASTVECSWLLAPAEDVPVADLLLEEAGRLRCKNTGRSRGKASILSKAAGVFRLQQKKPDPARALAIEISEYLKERFGNPMYGTIATIVSVALGRKVTLATVRQYCLPLSSKPTKTSAPAHTRP